MTPADVQALLTNEQLILRRQRLPEFAQLIQRRSAAQFEDVVFLGLGDDQRTADRTTALRHDRAQADVALQHDAHRSLIADGVAVEQTALAGAVDAAGHAAEHRHRRADRR